MSEAMRALGERIYEESLGDRRGFRSDQTGVPGELWPEIYEGVGRAAMKHCHKPIPINVVFDGPPGPTPGRFVEVETDEGLSLRVGEWIEREDGWWALRISKLPEGGES